MKPPLSGPCLTKDAINYGGRKIQVEDRAFNEEILRKLNSRPIANVSFRLREPWLLRAVAWIVSKLRRNQ